MRFLHTAGLILSTIVLATSTEWLPLYIKFANFTSASKLLFLEDYKIPCTQEIVENGQMECKFTYKIPESAWKSLESTRSDKDEAIYLGAGFILSATTFECGDEKSIISYGDTVSASRGLELLRTYQVYNRDLRKCSSDLSIHVYGPKEYARAGKIGSQAIIGKKNVIMSVKSTIDLVSSGLDFILCCLLISIYLMKRYFVKVNASQNTNIHYPWALVLWWLIFGLFRSGIIDTFFPFINDKLILLRIKQWVSINAHLGLAISTCAFLAAKKINPRLVKKLLIALLITIGIPVTTPFYGSFLTFGLAFSIIAYAYLSYRNINRYLSIPMTIFCTIELLKVQSVITYGSGSTTFIFVALAFSIDYLKENARMQTIATLSFIRKMALKNGESELAPEYVAPICETLGQYTVDVFIISGKREIEYAIRCTGKEGRFEICQYFDIAPITWLSAVLLDGSRYIDIEPGSPFDLFYKHQPANWPYRLMSVLPTSQSAEIVTIVHHTNPLAEKRTDELDHLFLSFELISLLATDLNYNKENFVRSKFASDLNSLLTDVAHLPSELKNDVDKNFALTNAIHKRLQIPAAILEYDPSDHALQVVSTSGFTETGSAYFSDVPWRAVPDNTLAPFSICIHRGKTVQVDDTVQMKASLHAFTLKFFDIESVNSFLLLPVIRNDGGPSKIIWLHSKDNNYFPRGLDTELGALTECIRAYDKTADEQQGIVDRIKKYLPSELSSGIIHGSEINTFSDGYLMMIDIRNSTKIANSIGVDNWLKLVEELLPRIKTIAENYSGRLIKSVWDAFFLTFDSEAESDGRSQQLYSVAIEIEEEVEKSFRTYNVAKMSENLTRVCVEFGDISTGLHHGSYTVVGAAMANINKLEQESKKLQGWYFFTPLSLVPNRNLFRASIKHPITDRMVWVADKYQDRTKIAA
jgi:hypothetical protein